MKAGKPELALQSRDGQLFPQAGMLAVRVSECSWRVALAVTEEHTEQATVLSCRISCSLFS